ncbi:NAD(P)/FAD-dependent oxidoreductase [Sphingobacterium hungaricum]
MLNKEYEVIIIGGSYAGLSAAMALGRSLRNVLVIDAGSPCNQQTPHSHNFLTQDGETPANIYKKAFDQVRQYKTIDFLEDFATEASKTDTGFTVRTKNNQTFSTKKLIISSGIKDQMPDIDGFSSSWGISVIHCPYCHGYEFRNEATGIFANGDEAMHYVKLLSQLTNKLSIFTNGPALFTEEQKVVFNQKGIAVIETPIKKINHQNGYLNSVQLADGQEHKLKALYARLPFKQHSAIPEQLGCTFSKNGFVEVSPMQETSVEGVFACGDNSNPMRSVANAVYTGNFAGASVNSKLAEESFNRVK